MVVLNVKRGDEAQFLVETTTKAAVAEVVSLLAEIFNGRLRVFRLAMAVEQLAAHGIAKTPDMQGLAPEQIAELGLKDETHKYYPSGGDQDGADEIGVRTGRAPTSQMQEVLTRTAAEAKAMISKDLVAKNVKLTTDTIGDALDKLRGAVMIVYPMGLPPYDEVQQILDDCEQLEGRQAAKEIIPAGDMQVWWAGKELQRGKALHEYVGRNEKTKIVCKVQKRGGGAPAREPLYDEKTQKEMMAYAYKKQEEWKKLEAVEDDSHLNAEWADGSRLRGQLQGVGNIKWR